MPREKNLQGISVKIGFDLIPKKLISLRKLLKTSSLNIYRREGNRMNSRLPESFKELVPPNLILSIHIPKTGGITLQAVLKEKFGDSLVLDYPHLNEIKKRKKPIKAIHGHDKAFYDLMFNRHQKLSQSE